MSVLHLLVEVWVASEQSTYLLEGRIVTSDRAPVVGECIVFVDPSKPLTAGRLVGGESMDVAYERVDLRVHRVDWINGACVVSLEVHAEDGCNFNLHAGAPDFPFRTLHSVGLRSCNNQYPRGLEDLVDPLAPAHHEWEMPLSST